MKKEDNKNNFFVTKLVVGKILSAEKVKNIDQLLKFQVDLKDRKIQVLSGIGKYYDPKDLINWKVIVIEKREPIELRGEISEGMFFCVREENRITLIKLEDKIEVGSKIL